MVKVAVVQAGSVLFDTKATLKKLKQFAADAVPTLKGHLSMAEDAKRAASGHTGTHTSALDNGDASQSSEQRSNRDSTVQGKNAQANPSETGK